MVELDANAFKTRTLEVRDGVELAFVREGIGGVPLVLLHGYPSTKRLFWRNIGPLADAGFEVIVPDQRGFGDSPRPEVRVDVVSSSLDVHALLTALGHERTVSGGGDFGSLVAQDMANRFPGFVIRQVIWNGAGPVMPERFEAAGVPGDSYAEVTERSSHFRDHGIDADGFAARFPTTEDRQAYVRSTFLENRVWREGGKPIQLVAPGAYDQDAADFMSEPFADEHSFRDSLGFHEGLMSLIEPKASTVTVEVPLIAQPNAVETLILHGILDQMIPWQFPRRLEACCDHPVGPFLLERSGHFVPFEAAPEFNRAVITFCRDLLAGSEYQPKDVSAGSSVANVARTVGPYQG